MAFLMTLFTTRSKFYSSALEPRRGEQAESLDDDDSTSADREHLLPGHSPVSVRQPSNNARNFARVAIAGVVLVCWGMMTFALGMSIGKVHREGAWGSFESGFVEEGVVTPPDMFELTQVTFSDRIDFTPDGEEMLAPSLYVGEPSREIDEAWNAIIGGESHYFSVSESEANQLWGADWEKYRDRIRGSWTGNLDMFHCLHCLNQLRKALRRDVYPEEQYRGMVHQLHCIDHLRQVIMCQGTSVISPSEWHTGRGQYINPKQAHTCRNFDKLHGFSKARYNGSIAVPRAPRVPLHLESQWPPSPSKP